MNNELRTKDIVKAYRLKNKLTQLDVAKLIGKSRPYVIDKERTGDWRIEELKTLANKFGVTVADLVRE